MLHRHTSGEGHQTAVLLHGLGGSHRYWAGGQRPFALPGHRTVAVDLLGFGASPKPWACYTVARHVEALRATLRDEVGFTLVGHSLGAALALAYAARYPAQVHRVVLMAVPVFAGPRDAAAWFSRRPGGWVYTHRWASALGCVVSRRVPGAWLPRLAPSMPPTVLADYRRHHVVASTSSLWQAVYQHDLARTADALPRTLPVMLLHGAADTTSPPDGARRLAAQRASWRVEMLDGVDHHPWLERPQDCIARIGAWLRAVDDGGATPIG